MKIAHSGPFFGMSLILTAAQAWASASYLPAQVEAHDVGSYRIQTTHFRDSTQPMDRFQMHQVTSALAHAARPPYRGSVLLLPSTGSNFKEYFFNQPSRSADSLAGYLAGLGYEVFGFSPSMTEFKLGDCDKMDCTPMRDWGLQYDLDQIRTIRRQIEILHPGEKPWIGGLSLGAILTWAAINEDPNGYRGAIVWEGSLFNEDPVLKSVNAGLCKVHEERLKLGQFHDQILLPAIKLALVTSERLLVSLLALPNPAVAGIAGFKMAEGDLLRGRFTYADPQRLRDLFGESNDYESVRVMRDVACSLAGERTFTGRLDRVTIPVLAIESENGFGAQMDAQLALLGSSRIPRRVTRIFQEGFGHADAYLSVDHRRWMETPIAEWLESSGE